MDDQSVLPSVKKPQQLAKSALEVPMESRYMPPPLSPRRLPQEPGAGNADNAETQSRSTKASKSGTKRTSSESISWLDTIDDESLKSPNPPSLSLSAVHTQPSNSSLANEIEAEFDAALNAAVDAAYDSEDIETEDTPKVSQKAHLFDMSSTVPKMQSRDPMVEGRARADSDVEAPQDYLDEDTTEEEERLLDEMTDGYDFDDFTFDSKSKSALPRQSDSSTFSGRTQSSSNQSTTLTAATNLSTLNEDTELTRTSPSKDPTLPRAAHVETSPSRAGAVTSPQRIERLSAVTLRDRRLSGQNALKIETYAPARGTAQFKGVPKLDIPAPDMQKPLPMPGPPSTGTVPVTPKLDSLERDTSQRVSGNSGSHPGGLSSQHRVEYCSSFSRQVDKNNATSDSDEEKSLFD
ncbi:uncharacterized protein AB675_10347 [Cyphellophora attinorum]|uniref:Uncharacterized protein n=1 Tax=Cyphellophora attinorum TaxID=1664694 RepID=A0A0N0NK07_9EURO|nr:uncharacterized protein AB675_10347 [Phialophora attinorum]KPI37498.1 hypothetical protein AB675_10347 [Phialophora attinorum]